jgi:hypothetical protein
MQKTTLLLFSFFIPASFLFGQTIIKGKIIDKNTKEPIECVTIRKGISGNSTMSDKQGNFRLSLRTDTGTIFISHIGYRSQQLLIDSSSILHVIELEHGPVDMDDVTISSSTNNNSFHTISSIDLNLHPVNSSQDLMRFVPGLFLGQHQGGGIAEHIFFRGFDADHGTDVNVSVDGMPLNLVSHAHGQGFADLHYLIPELVKNYDYGKGPYYNEYGDFTTAGYVSFNTYDILNKSFIKLEGGQYNTGRAAAAINLLSDKAKQKGETAYIAGEIAYTDGAFDWAQHFYRSNLYGKYNVNLSSKTKLTITLSDFNSNWRSSGEIPERAVAEGLIGRFGYIDSAQGGSTSRANAILKINSNLSDKLSLENQVYYSRYAFDLHYDPTFFADDSVNGDQLRQKETRDLFGYNGKLTQHTTIGNNVLLTSIIGVGAQLNKIYNSELSHTIHQTTILDSLQYGDVTESILNGYVDESLQKGKWLFNAGSRLDYFYFDYMDKLAAPQPSTAQFIVSPKINIEYTFNAAIQLYIKTGKGFHSNDAKAVAANGGNTLPPAYGADLGINWKPVRHLFINAALWYLYLDHEFVYSADDGTTALGDKTRREGIDLSARYQFNKWLFATTDLNVANAKDLQASAGQNYLPLAVPFSSTGGLECKFANGLNGAVTYRYMSDRPANEDNSLVAQGYFVTDLTANYTKPKYEIGLEIQNLFNTQWREAQFEITSRLKGEPQPVDDISFTAGKPFLAKLKLAIFFK